MLQKHGGVLTADHAKGATSGRPSVKAGPSPALSLHQHTTQQAC
jgi:hypothetical protein